MSNRKKLVGFYRGKVISNKDLQGSGKIGVFIPRLMSGKIKNHEPVSFDMVKDNRDSTCIWVKPASHINMSKSDYEKYSTKSGSFDVPREGSYVAIFFLDGIEENGFYLPGISFPYEGQTPGFKNIPSDLVTDLLDHRRKRNIHMREFFNGSIVGYNANEDVQDFFLNFDNGTSLEFASPNNISGNNLSSHSQKPSKFDLRLKRHDSVFSSNIVGRTTNEDGSSFSIISKKKNTTVEKGLNYKSKVDIDEVVSNSILKVNTIKDGSFGSLSTNSTESRKQSASGLKVSSSKSSSTISLKQSFTDGEDKSFKDDYSATISIDGIEKSSSELSTFSKSLNTMIEKEKNEVYSEDKYESDEKMRSKLDEDKKFSLMNILRVGKKVYLKIKTLEFLFKEFFSRFKREEKFSKSKAKIKVSIEKNSEDNSEDTYRIVDNKEIDGNKIKLNLNASNNNTATSFSLVNNEEDSSISMESVAIDENPINVATFNIGELENQFTRGLKFQIESEKGKSSASLYSIRKSFIPGQDLAMMGMEEEESKIVTVEEEGTETKIKIDVKGINPTLGGVITISSSDKNMINIESEAASFNVVTKLGNVNVEALNATVIAKLEAKIEALSAIIEAKAEAKVKSVLTEIEGSGMVDIKSDGLVTVSSPIIMLGGAGASMPALLGPATMAWLSTHMHVGNKGFPTSPPITPVGPHMISKTVLLN